MNKGYLIVMEGACDGIGKSTQYDKLRNKLNELGYKVISHHFPSYDTFYGKLVEAYLAGKFGSIEELSPYFINSLYAIDRACAWNLELKEAYDSGAIVLLDRYTTSSIIYQSTTFNSTSERKKFIDYVSDYEYNKLGIPKPDMVLFLDAPFDLVTELRQQRVNYEGNSHDIHESNIEFMKKVYENAEDIAVYLKWERINCVKDNKFKNIDVIHEDIIKKVLKKIKA